MSSIQTETVRHAKTQEKVTHTQEVEAVNGNRLQFDSDIGVSSQRLQSMFRKLKEVEGKWF